MAGEGTRSCRGGALVGVALAGLAALVAGCGTDYEPPPYGPPPGARVVRIPPLPPRRPASLPPLVERAPLPAPAPEAPPPPTRPTPPGLAALAPPHARLYRVRSGETVYGIARRFGIEMGALVRMNHMAPPYRINAGESLLVPEQNSPPERVAMAAPAPGAAPLVPSPAALEPPAAAPFDVAPPPRAGTGFEWPVRGHVLTAFGRQKDGLRNDGINIAAKEGTPVRAADNGVVVYAGNELPGFGNLLILRHAGGWMTAYAHNSSAEGAPGRDGAARPDRRHGRPYRRGWPAAAPFRDPPQGRGGRPGPLSDPHGGVVSWRRSVQPLAEPAGEVLDELPGDAAGAGAARDRPFVGLGVQRRRGRSSRRNLSA